MAQGVTYGLMLASTVIFIGFVGAYLLNRKNIPDAIFLILFGYILGPLTNVVDPKQFLGVATYIGALALIAIMFESSLDIDLNELMISAKPALILSFAGFIISTLITFIFLHFILGLTGDNPLYALLIGTIIGGSSGAIIASIAPRLSMPSNLQLTLSLESVLTDVYVIVFALTILSILRSQIIGAGGIDISLIAGQIASTFSTSIVIGFIAGIFLADLIYRFKREQHLYVMTFAYMILVYAGTEFVGGSGAIAVLVSGIILSNLAYLPQLIAGSGIVDIVRYQLFSMESTHSELTLLIKVFFFVEVGLILNLSDMYLLLISIILSVLLLLARYPLTYIVSKNMGFRYRAKIAAAISSFFYGRGLSAAVMAVIVSQATIEFGGEVVNIIPVEISMYIMNIASAVILFTNIILTMGVILLRNRVKELLL